MMFAFGAVLLAFILVTLIVQLLTKMKIVGANEIGVVAGKGREGLATLRGGRVFVFPLVHRFFRMDLRPRTTTVQVESAIAAGIVPLTVVATVSFAVASAGSGLRNAIRRIITLMKGWDELTDIATSIIEGHLRDSIATMTPEEVMTDKDRLVQNMIRVCKLDLEGIGLEITSMNIADVDDHRLEGVEEPELYIALLKRIQSTNADTQSREAQASARAAAKEEAETRRADVTVRASENDRESLEADTRVQVASEQQRAAIGVQQAQRDAEARVAGTHAQIEAERRRIEMLRSKFEAEILTPAEAEKERLILEAKAQAAELRGTAQAEIDQLERTIGIIRQGGKSGLQAYVIENFAKFSEPFARTLGLLPVGHAAVISGAQGSHEPISAIHPHPIENAKARVLRQGLAGAAAHVADPRPTSAAASQAPDASHKEAQACVVHCMDLRIQGTVDNLIAGLGLSAGEFDRVSVAGGAGNAEQLVEHLRLSERLHHTQALILTAHEDCGAGATRESLIEALAATRRAHEDHTVRGFWIHLDGTWEEIGAA